MYGRPSENAQTEEELRRLEAFKAHLKLDKDNTEQLIHDTHCVSVRQTQYWSLCGCRLCSVNQEVGRQCAPVGRQNGLYCKSD